MVYHINMLFKTCILTARKTKVKNKLKALKKEMNSKNPKTANKGSNTKQEKYLCIVDVHNICQTLSVIMYVLEKA